MSESIYSIYKVTNIVNNKVYIGYTEKYGRRKIKHKNCAFDPENKSYELPLYRSIRKHGWDKFKFEIIYQCKDKEFTLNVMENYFIMEYNSFYFGYNMTFGGNKSPKPEWIKEQISKTLTGRIFTEDHRRKIGEANKLRVITDATKQKLREYNTGLKQSEDTIRKRVDKTKGRPQPHTPQRTLNISKRYIITFPEGHEEEIRNMAKFCREHDLDKSGMYKAASGKIESYEGYKAREIPKNS